MFFSKRVKLSIIVIFFDMQREAQRTLFSLSKKYQRDIDFKYEIIALDNGSKSPLDKKKVESIDQAIRYKYVASNSVSPCKAINNAVKDAKGEYVMCCIDGARILSPNILSKTMQAINSVTSPFIYTLAFHLGPKPQKESIKEGYTKKVEDILLDSIDWKKNGYELFNISTIAPSSKKGYFSEISETNCFTVKKPDYFRLGGYNEAFVSAGGGLSNMELFQRFTTSDTMTPIVLLGEATFHQVHGGAITNQIDDREKKLQIAFDEFYKIKKEKYIHKSYKITAYGSVDKLYHTGLLNFE